MSAAVTPTDVDTSGFATQVLQRSRELPVLVDFWADWCGPCKTLAPVLERIAADYEGRIEVAKLDVDAEPAVAGQLGVRSLPTLKLFHDERVIDEIVGAQPEGRIREILDRHLDALGLDAGSGHEDLDTRRERLEAEVTANPDDVQRALALAEVRAMQGDTGDATALLDRLPVDAQTGDVANRIRALAHFGEALRDVPSRQALEARVAEAPEDLDTRHQLAARLMQAEQHEAALEQLLEIMRRDRRHRDELGRRALVAAFTILGPQSALTAHYRRKMSALLM